MNPDSAELSQWIAVGRLLRPQGRRGELLVEPLTDLSGTFETGRRVRLAGAVKEPASDSVIEDCWRPTGRNAGRIVVKLEGIDSISDAERVAGRELLIQAKDLPALDTDTWFVADLVGCTLFDGDRAVGAISGVQYAVGADGRTRLDDTAPLLQIEPSSAESGEPVLVPFVKAWLESVDLAGKAVRMHLPEGLLTLPDESSETS